jgi:DnaJ-domain-containing protein 1
VSITKRIIDSARSGLNTLLDAVGAGGPDPEADAVAAEIERRHQARGGRKPDAKSPLARMAGASSEARRERERAAATREERVRGARNQRAADEQRARDEAFRRVKERAWQPGATSSTAGGPRPGASSSGPRRPPPNRAVEQQIAKHYKTLDLPAGSDFAAVKASYRRLMRKYHPDLHGHSPDKQRAATELTKQITQAYNELEAHLMGGPNRT